MMRKFAVLLLLTAPALAQNDLQKPVAVVNGQTITAQELDQMYDHIGAQMREQYEKAGGKAAFLDQYVNKRLIVQEALKSGFERRADVQRDVSAAKEGAVFDDYVRDIIGGDIVKESDIRAYYDQHQKDYATPARIRVRHIVITANPTGPRARSKEQALDIIQKISGELHEEWMTANRMKDPQAVAQMHINQFAQLARQYSEDASAQTGGDLGFVEKGQLDPDFEAAAWGLPVGVPSGIVQTKYGYHLIVVEAKQPVGVKPYEEVKSSIRDGLLSQKMADVMTALSRLTNELRRSSKISVYPENIK